MNDLVGVTLEFEDGRKETSDAVTQMYMAAPDMYAILKTIEEMYDDGNLNLPDPLIQEIKEVLSCEEDKNDPDVIRGCFRKTE